MARAKVDAFSQCGREVRSGLGECFQDALLGGGEVAAVPVIVWVDAAEAGLVRMVFTAAARRASHVRSARWCGAGDG